MSSGRSPARSLRSRAVGVRVGPLRSGMRVLLIGPTALDAGGRPIKQRRLHLPGLTMSMLGAVTPPEVTLRAVCETVSDIPFAEHWDLVGVTGMGSGIVRAWQIADEFRARGVTVVQGGVAASLGDPELSLAHADSLVLGEAEDLWPRILADAGAHRLQRIYRADAPPAIDRLPVPRYDLFPRHKLGFWRPVQATRGCPFPCSFCSIRAFYGGSYRKVPVERVIRDVRAAKRHGTRHIAFIDDNIGVDFDYAARLFEALIPEDIRWMSQCSLHITERPEMMKLAHASGCRLLSIGIETTSRAGLEAVNKQWNRPERYAAAIRALRDHGIDVSTEMMIGLDGDDASVFERTYRFIMDNHISVPRVHIMTPIPGTPMWNEMLEQGRLRSADYGGYSGGNVVFQPRHIDADELQAGYWRLYERLFSLRAIARRLGRNRASLQPLMRAFVGAVNLHYKDHIRRGITPGIV